MIRPVASDQALCHCVQCVALCHQAGLLPHKAMFSTDQSVVATGAPPPTPPPHPTPPKHPRALVHPTWSPPTPSSAHIPPLLKHTHTHPSPAWKHTNTCTQGSLHHLVVSWLYDLLLTCVGLQIVHCTAAGGATVAQSGRHHAGGSDRGKRATGCSAWPQVAVHETRVGMWEGMGCGFF